MLLLLLACVVGLCRCEVAEGGAPEDSAVIDLTAEMFNEAISSNPVILVEFYAPW